VKAVYRQIRYLVDILLFNCSICLTPFETGSTTTDGSGELKSSFFSMSSVRDDDDVRCGEVAMSGSQVGEERGERSDEGRIRWEEEKRDP